MLKFAKRSVPSSLYFTKIDTRHNVATSGQKEGGIPEGEVDLEVGLIMIIISLRFSRKNDSKR
jgi:hypothetical protein